MNLKGKVAMITGASVGIGRATAIVMAEKGADLVLLDINAEKLQEVCETLRQYNCAVEAYTCDVSDEAQVNAAIANALSKFQKIDILVNNAALWRDKSLFSESTSDLWKKYIDVNIMGVYY